MEILKITRGTNVNILVTVDEKYIKPLIYMLKSFGNEHYCNNFHLNEETDVYIAHSSLNDEQIAYIQNSVLDFPIKIHGIKITEKWFKGTPVLERLPEESFYRLMAFEYLPENVKKCLYLDPDILIIKPLFTLYNMDIDDYYIAAAGHVEGFVNKFNLARLGIETQNKYLNSGVMLMNIEKIRSDFSIDYILSVLNENIDRLLMGDQDLANILFIRKAKVIDERVYNLDERTMKRHRKSFSLDDVRSETAIVHYNGKYKPWLEGYKGVLDELYPFMESRGPAPKGKKWAQTKAVFSIICATKRQRILFASLIVCIVTCIFCYFFFGKSIMRFISEPDLFQAWLSKFGVFDEIAFIFIRAAQTVVKFIPAEPLEIASGYAWGTFYGTLYCIIGNFIGTIFIIILTRKFGKRFIDIFLPGKTLKSMRIFQNSEKMYTMLFFLYLIPGSPKDGFTYVVGLLPIKIVPFLIITFIARIPAVLSSTICGSGLASKRYLFSAAIFIGTAILAVVCGIIYKKYMKKKSDKIQIEM